MDGASRRRGPGRPGLRAPRALDRPRRAGLRDGAGPFLPTTLAAALLALHGGEAARGAFLPGLADGSLVGAVGLGGNLELGADGRLAGSAGLVLGAELAQLLLVCVGDDVALLQADQRGVTVEPQKNLDPSRRVCAVDCDAVEVSEANLLRGARIALERLARTLGAAEAAGGARACTEMATEYAKVRQHPISSLAPPGRPRCAPRAHSPGRRPCSWMPRP